MSRKPERSGLFHGFWYTLTGLKIERVKRSEYGEAYRLYSLGSEMGLTDRGRTHAVQRPVAAGSAFPRSVSPNASYTEANPFH